MKYLTLICLFLLAAGTFSQEVLNEQQLEDLAEVDEAETEDEYDLQQLQHLKNHPLNINDPSVVLSELPLLNSLLISNLISYRTLLGEFVSAYELQAVPGFTVELIRSILPYITITDAEAGIRNWRARFTSGDHTIVTRPTFPAKLYFRYKYQHRNLLQYGAIGERDAGEKSLVDFYSFHLFMRNAGIIKSLALGDYVLNIGQGLIHWQSQAFKKTASVINVKRQAEIIRPYHSAGEYNFQRGAALTLKKYDWETTVFASLRNITTNISEDEEHGEVITSINTSGLHRTENELADKNNSSVMAYGGNVRYLLPGGHIGLNGIHYVYSRPLLKRDEPYNLFAVKGDKWSNYSADYAWTFRNFHFFGELAMAWNGSVAFLNGFMASLNAAVDIAIVHRNISERYQSLYGNAFTENTAPTNERGIYAGLSLKPHNNWRIDAYTDMFSFPWLRYRADAPSFGQQYFLQVTWKPNRQVEAYTRFRLKTKPLNTETVHGRYPEDRTQRNWRTHVSFQLSRVLSLRSRVELCWFGKPGASLPETGWLMYGDIVYKPMGKWYSGNFRLQFFETESYDTRLYAYENDVLFSSSTPLYYSKGLRSYINIRGKLRLRWPHRFIADLGIKTATTIYYPTGYQSNNVTKPSLTSVRLQLFLSPYHRSTINKS